MPETTPDTGTETTPPTETTTQTVEDLAAEVEKWKSLSRKHEDKAKANAGAAKELETVKQSTMSDIEKAVAQAKADGASEATKAFGGRLVSAEVKAAAAGRNLDVDTLLEGLNASRFLGDDGEPDVAAITEWVDRLAPKGETQTQPAPLDLGQGTRDKGSGAIALNDPLLADLILKVGQR